jgi:hypothetical protein
VWTVRTLELLCDRWLTTLKTSDWNSVKFARHPLEGPGIRGFSSELCYVNFVFACPGVPVGMGQKWQTLAFFLDLGANAP